MQIDYEKSLKGSFLILQVEDDRETDYQVQMLVQNRIPGFLSCRLYHIDDRLRFCYDITGRRSLAEIMQEKQITGELLRNLILGIDRAVKSTEKYLLNADGLQMSAECIYRNNASGEILFCWFPDVKETVWDGVHSIAEAMLERLDHSCPGTVSLGYAFYQKTAGKTYSAEELCRLLGEGEPLKKPPYKDRNAIERHAEAAETAEGEIHCESQSRQSLYAWIGVLAGTAGALVFMLTYRRGQLLSAPSGQIIAFILFVVMGSAAYFFINSRARSRSAASIHNRKADTEDCRESCEEGCEKEMVCAEEVPDVKQKDKGDDRTEAGIRTVGPTSFGGRSGETALLEPEGDREDGCLICMTPGTYPDNRLTGEQVTIGRGQMTGLNTLCESGKICEEIRCGTVSRIHARICRRNGSYYLLDLHSSNGTYCNGQPVSVTEETLLQAGDHIRFADVEYQLREWH